MKQSSESSATSQNYYAESPKRKAESDEENVTNTPTKKPHTSDTSKFSGTPNSRISNTSPVVKSTTNNIKKPIIIGFDVIVENEDISGVNFKVSSQRPETVVGGGKQGNHVTAYVVFLDMIYNAIDDKNINQIPEFLIKIFNSILPYQSDNLKKKIEKIEAIKIINRDSRKLITSALDYATTLKESLSDFERIKNGLSEEDQEKMGKLTSLLNITSQLDKKDVKSTLKFAQTTHMANMVVAIGEEILVKLNIEEDMCFPRQNSVLNPAEGAIVKNAIYALKAFDELLKFNNTSNNQDFFDSINAPASKLSSGVLVILKSLPLDYTNDAKDPAKNYLLKIKNSSGRNAYKLVNNIITNKDIAKSIGGFVANLFDFSYKDHSGDDDVSNTLCKICARHLVIIFTTFDCGNLKPNIIDEFLQKVLVKEGWGNFEIEGVNLDLATLQSMVNDYADFKDVKMVTNEPDDVEIGDESIQVTNLCDESGRDEQGDCR